MHHIFINENEIDLKNKIIMIDSESENYNHLVKSLRVEKGEDVLCSVDGFMQPFDYRSSVKDIDSEKIILSIEENVNANELPIKINLYQGITKFDKFEFIIEKVVELGVYSIIPVATEYCIAKIGDKKIEKKLERFNRISKSAAEQSKRHIVPEVKGPMDYKALIKLIGKNCSNENALDISNTTDYKCLKKYNLLFYENAEGIEGTKKVIKSIIDFLKCIKNNTHTDNEQMIEKDNFNDIEINVIIGPEGGFSENEIQLAKGAGINILSLGDRILRTETAAITALSILMYEFNS